MVGTVTPSEEAQLTQTIEMFEVITQSQPQDYQSLEILKEAYVKLGREEDALSTSKRIAQAYVLMGQLSSAILEYESIIQRFPEDPDAQQALEELESKARGLDSGQGMAEVAQPSKNAAKSSRKGARAIPTDLDDGRDSMHKLFVEAKVITNAQFEECWVRPGSQGDELQVPFIQLLADKGYAPIERLLRTVCEKTRVGYLPLEKYDIDIELARSFPADTCRRWCVLPIDRMSKSILVATANPFNRQAAAEVEEIAKERLLWYLVPPPELIKALKKVFRS
jgi:tetratricopeptide (TPR) repeat protein